MPLVIGSAASSSSGHGMAGALALGTFVRPQLFGAFCGGGHLQQQRRSKYTKTNSYRVPARAHVFTRSFLQRPHIGIRALSAEFVEIGRTVVKQRKYIAKNPNVTAQKHFKLYPGENIRVAKDTSLVAMCSGRVKFTHDVTRDVKIANVLPEAREELLEDDLWRYRTEHVSSMEENKVLCSLRQKALPVFGKEWVKPPPGMRPQPDRLTKGRSSWWNPHIQDPMAFVEHAYPISKSRMLLRRKIRERTMNIDDAVKSPTGISNMR
ncbi:unnamed protein product [Amoebophrya sp. A25]|nr:unnamed protein product [Amoebophrya sp. A25]|eukprot:GSA25T00015951001.1